MTTKNPYRFDKTVKVSKLVDADTDDDDGIWTAMSRLQRRRRRRDKNEFSIMRMDDHIVCPVFGIEKYVSGAAGLGINLKLGYLFRILDRSRKQVLEVPVSHSVMYGRLKQYLRELGIDEGETPHSFRGGVRCHVGSLGFWKRSGYHGPCWMVF